MPTLPQDALSGPNDTNSFFGKFKKLDTKERTMKASTPKSAETGSIQETDSAFMSDISGGLDKIVNVPPIHSSTPRRNSGERSRCESSGSSSLFTTTSSDTSSMPQTPDSEKGVPFTGLTINLADPLAEHEYCVPIIGYEIMEERARFTIFKIQVVHQTVGLSWYVFRRYTDFVRLNRKLRVLFPGLRFALPPKRWFGDNFDPSFLDDRLLGLQAFVNNIISHQQIYQSAPVREFFCLDEPLGGNDSLEESRARCESLEELVYSLRQELRGKQSEVELLKGELAVVEAQKETLIKSLRLECSLAAMNSNALKATPSFRKIHTLNVALLNIIEKVNRASQTSSESDLVYSSDSAENTNKDAVQDLIETAVDALQLDSEHLSSVYLNSHSEDGTVDNHKSTDSLASPKKTVKDNLDNCEAQNNCNEVQNCRILSNEDKKNGHISYRRTSEVISLSKISDEDKSSSVASSLVITSLTN